MVPSFIDGAAIGRLAALACSALCLMACTTEPTGEGTPALGESRSADSDENHCNIDDTLYVGDRDISDAQAMHNDVAQFDADTGTSLGPFVAPGSGGLFGPSAFFFLERPNEEAELLVANQNIGLPPSGDVLRYRGTDGAFIDQLVEACDPAVPSCHAPFTARGMVLGSRDILYIADQGGDAKHEPRVARFDARTGDFRGNLHWKGQDGAIPRDLIIGPDGQLYVVAVPPLGGAGGQIVRFNLESGTFLNIVFDATDPSSLLNRPTGLAFSPDGRLYTISNSRDSNSSDADRIVILEVHDGHGHIVDHIDLDQAGSPPHAGSELIFGPRDDLFVTFNLTGELRRYDVHEKTFVELVPTLGALSRPGYLAFRGTDPATRAYQPCATHQPSPDDD